MRCTLENAFFAYKSGVYNSGCSNDINHAIAVIGWGVQDGRDYFSLVNSWGDASEMYVAPCVTQVWVVPGRSINSQESPKSYIPWHRTRGDQGRLALQPK